MDHVWKFGIVGAGGMGTAWAKTISQSQRTRLEVWVDSVEGLAEKKSLELGLNQTKTNLSLDEALKSGLIDVVLDATPPDIHPMTVVSALDAGIPVLGEKPMAMSLVEAKRMVKASEKSGKLYCVSQNYRFNNQVSGFSYLVNQIGKLAILNADFYIGAHFGGFRDKMESPLLLDMAIHTFDLARAISGCDPVSVYAEEFNPTWSWYQGDACAQAMFTMSNEVRFNYRGAWIGHGFHTPWNSEWRAVGELGTALWNGVDPSKAEIIRSDEGFVRETESVRAPEFDDLTGLEGSLHSFLNALEGGSRPPTECHNNLKSLAMVFAAVESSRIGCRVKIDL